MKLKRSNVKEEKLELRKLIMIFYKKFNDISMY